VPQTGTGNILVTVKNDGNAVDAFDVTLTDTTAGILQATLPVMLAPGVSVVLTMPFSPPSNAAVTNHVLTAAVAPLPGETDLSDNVRTKSVAVKALLRDLVMSSLSLPSSPRIGTTVLVSIKVTNKGLVPENVTLTLTDNTTGTMVAQTVVAVAPGASAAVKPSWLVEGPAGTHSLTALAAAVPGETLVSNNAKTSSVKVVP
jgi:hypothetical protein